MRAKCLAEYSALRERELDDALAQRKPTVTKRGAREAEGDEADEANEVEAAQAAGELAIPVAARDGCRSFLVAR